jgi:hypothetical protein
MARSYRFVARRANDFFAIELGSLNAAINAPGRLPASRLNLRRFAYLRVKAGFH